MPSRNAALKTSFATKKDIIFTPAGWPESLPGDLYLPKTKKPAPGVLLIHGGGWTGGDKRSQMSSIAKRLAKRGYVVFNVTYRSAPQWKHPAQYNDLAEALKWMEAHANEINLDKNRLATFGYSAGGHLSELVGLKAEEEGFPIKAIVAGGAPSDLTITDSPLVNDFIGGKRDEKPDEYRDASPINFVTKNSPPVFLYHAPKDDLVWPLHSEKIAKELKAKGVEHEFRSTMGRGHISGFLLPGSAISGAIAFLDQHLRSTL